MKCAKCDKEAAFKVEELQTPEHKIIIVCHVHFIDLCAYMARQSEEFLLKGLKYD